MTLFKGQSSVEYMTLLMGFLMLTVPIVFFLLSYTSVSSNAIKQQQLDASVNLLKSSLESAFVDCPSEKMATLSLPDLDVNISLKSDYMGNLGKPYLEVHSRTLDYVKPLDVNAEVLGNIKFIEGKGRIVGSGLHRVKVNCTIIETAKGKDVVLEMVG